MRLQNDNQEDGPSDSVSSDEPFWPAAKSFQNGMKALGNWEWVLWAIRYLANNKINPHPLLVIKKKKRYIFPYKESERTRPLSVTMATQIHYVLSSSCHYGLEEKKKTTLSFSLFFVKYFEVTFHGMSLKQLFLSGKEGRAWEGNKGGAESLGMLRMCLRGTNCGQCSQYRWNWEGRKKVINIYWVFTTCLALCLIMNSLQPLRVLSVRERTKQAIMI